MHVYIQNINKMLNEYNKGLQTKHLMKLNEHVIITETLILLRDLPPSLQQGVGFGIYLYIG